jgi:hypothetical protein
MAKKKGKAVSFDAMVKFFLQSYNIPTKKDIDKLNARLDNLERLIRGLGASGTNRNLPGGFAAKSSATRKKTAVSASAKTLEVIKRFKNGVGFAEIQTRTGFEDKKLRNIIFRLHDIGKIKRKSRGIYISS